MSDSTNVSQNESVLIKAFHKLHNIHLPSISVILIYRPSSSTPDELYNSIINIR